MKQCDYCRSRNILELSGKYYCETCEIYYVYKDGKQEYSNLPIEDIDQMTVGDHMCKSCRPKYFGKRIVSCTTYREYLRKLPLCFLCKKSNGKCIKNAFFKNFIFYRTYKRVFSIQCILLYTVCFYLLNEYAVCNLLFVNLVDYRRNGFSILGNFIKSASVVALHFWVSESAMCYIYCLLFMLFSKKWIYEVPVNLDQSSPNLLEYLEQLNIGKSRRRR